MSQEFKTIPYRLNTVALCYLVNGDSSGISDEEISQIDTWYETEFDGAKFVVFESVEDTRDMGMDDISGLLTDTVQVTANIAV